MHTMAQDNSVLIPHNRKTACEWVKPKFHYANFYRNFPAGKVTNTNHESCGHKPSRHVEMFATNPFVSL